MLKHVDQIRKLSLICSLNLLESKLQTTPEQMHNQFGVELKTLQQLEKMLNHHYYSTDGQ